VLEEVAGDRHLAIEIGSAEAFSLAARLDGKQWPRPMTYQFVAALVQALGGRVRQVRIDRAVERAYAATVEVEGPPGVQAVDARSSDALNLAALVQAPILVAPEVLVEAEARRTGDSPEAARLVRHALNWQGRELVSREDRFYGEVLGLVVEEENGLLRLRIAEDRDIVVYPKPDHIPATYTILNFPVDDLEATVDALAQRGVVFERYQGFEQDERGILRSQGPPIAWFKDPAGNILSVIQD
jgi:bifunctional DNase/RNase/catechol 2,3-dioxygenase-like lactoylglutathione lyase family enzyme